MHLDEYSFSQFYEIAVKRLFDELIKYKLKQALKSGICQLIMYKNYDAEKLLNKRSIEWLKKLFSNYEIKEFRQSITQMRDNFIETAKRFPE
jgi:hypothetical protein